MNKVGRLCIMVLVVALLTSCQSSPVPVSSQPEPEPWETAQLFLAYATSQGDQEESIGILNTKILEASEGRIYCNAYPSGAMGSDQELMNAVRSGALTVVQLATSVQTKQIPELALLDTPYLFSDLDSCNEQLSGPLLEFFQPYYNREGLQLLAWYCPGFRQLSCNIPVERPRDLKRLKIRILDNPYHQIYWSAVGAQPVVIPFSDLFYAIQQGIVNAQENPPNAAISIQLQQLQDYIILTDHLPFISAVVMNKADFDQLAPEDQQIVTQAFQEHCSSMRPMMSTEELKAYFSYVLSPSEQLQEALLQGGDAVRQALSQDLGADITEQFYSIMEESA